MTAPTIRELTVAYLVARRVGKTQERVLERVVSRLGRVTPDNLTPARLAAYKAARKVAEPTLRRELGALAAVLAWAEKAKVIPRGSAPVIDLPAPGQARERHMTAEQAHALTVEALRRNECPGLGLFVAIALHTGARKAAIQALTWDRVNLPARTIDFREPGQALSKKRRVAVPMNQYLYDLLLWEFDRLPQYRQGSRVCGSTTLRYAFQSLTLSLGLDWVTPHVLRHTAVTLMLQAGATPWEVGGVVGDTAATIERVYGHHTTGGLRSAVDRLAPAASS